MNLQNGNNIKKYTVTEITNKVKTTLTGNRELMNVFVEGEVTAYKPKSNYKYKYFSLKDDKNIINCVIFSEFVIKNMNFELENGQKVIVLGEINCYGPQSQYQLRILRIEKVGEGEINKAYLELRRKLEEQGLFDKKYKQKIPDNAKNIGIITSESGSAIRDIEKNAMERNPYVQLWLFPTLVQGEGAAFSIAERIEQADKMGFDIIIIGRGGGSTEDIWPFNEEIVAWAIFNSETPIISGTGHEDYETIADLVADLAVSTPTAAAVAAVPNIMPLLRSVSDYRRRITNAVFRKYSEKENNLSYLKNSINKVSPDKLHENRVIKLNNLKERLNYFMEWKMNSRDNRCALLLSRLDGLSPTAKLKGGYGYIENEEGRPVDTIKNIKENDRIRITVHDGQIEGIVDNIKEK